MSVVLRHKMFPLVIVYKDPQKSWDKTVEARLIEEIKKDGFSNFVELDWEGAKLFLGIKPVAKKVKKKSKATKKNKKKSDETREKKK
jgi:hypothetical protein